MGDAVNKEQSAPITNKRSWFKSLKAEFNKIIWPDKESLMKQSIAVVASSIALGLIIALLDLIIKFGINLII